MNGVDRPVTQGQHTVSPAGRVAGCRKQIADGRTPGPHVSYPATVGLSAGFAFVYAPWLLGLTAAAGVLLVIGAYMHRQRNHQ